MSDKSAAERRAESIIELMKMVGKDPGQPPTLNKLKQEVRQFGSRRCDKPGIDNLTYYAGYAIACNGGLDIDSVSLTGLLSSAKVAYQILANFCASEVEDEDATVLDALRKALEQPHVDNWAQAQGSCLQHNRLAALDEQRTASFLESDANDPEASWRRAFITADQHYRVADQCRILGRPIPELINRGEAYDFIAMNGGNMRLRAKRTPPPSLEFS